MNEVSTNQVFRFAEFTLDPGRAALLRGSEEIPLRQRTFEVLTYLVRHSGRMVSKQELFEAVWRDVAVTDDSLVQCLVEIRRALGDDQDRVRTIRGRGYLFEGAVPQSLEPSTAREAVLESVTPAPWPRGAAWLLVAVAILGAGAWLFVRSLRPCTRFARTDSWRKPTRRWAGRSSGSAGTGPPQKCR